MRKTKILLSVLGAPSKALAQQGQLIDKDIRSCAEIILAFELLKKLIDSRSHSIYSHSLSCQQRPELETDLLGLHGRKNAGEKGGNKRLQSSPSHTYIYTMSVYIYSI